MNHLTPGATPTPLSTFLPPLPVFSHLQEAALAALASAASATSATTGGLAPASPLFTAYLPSFSPFTQAFIHNFARPVLTRVCQLFAPAAAVLTRTLTASSAQQQPSSPSAPEEITKDETAPLPPPATLCREHVLFPPPVAEEQLNTFFSEYLRSVSLSDANAPFFPDDGDFFADDWADTALDDTHTDANS